ncbi:ribosomal protein S18-alanine N-acetyltransferase [Nitrospiraceae bacterium AH_259_D15_M11_P09]|nr:ribosomal protein S18-alanine N-acetyltransferase [Nitrospiraceae bacterium AH_259_D15_M11_P09]
MNARQAARLRIEPATHQDLAPILRIEQASFSSPWTRKMFEADLSHNPFGRFLTARLDPDGGARKGDLVGYMCYWLVFDELRLMNLAVEPSMRRQGIASDLIRHMLSVGRESGAVRAVLEVRASNVAARSLYERVGFRQVAVRRRYYTDPVEDAVLLGMEPLQELLTFAAQGADACGRGAHAVGDRALKPSEVESICADGSQENKRCRM